MMHGTSNNRTGNARIVGLEKDLGLKGYDYNKLLSIYFVSDVLFQIPWNVMCKIVKPGWWLPGISLGFGLTCLCMAFVHNFAQAAAVRFMLGKFGRSTIVTSVVWMISV